MIAELKKHIDLSDVVRGAGIELKQHGTRHVGFCPFHTEKTPSFYVFPDNGFKCFGCGEHGDSIDFVQKLYGLSFPDTLKHLGIEQGRMTSKMKAQIEQRKRKAELIKRFRKWESRYSGYLGSMINKTLRLMRNGIKPEDLDLHAPLFHGLPIWEYHSKILTEGSDKQKLKLYKEAQRWMKEISI